MKNQIFLKNILYALQVSGEIEKTTSMDEWKRLIVSAYLEYCKGDVSRVSRMLKISRQSIYNMMKDKNEI